MAIGFTETLRSFARGDAVTAERFFAADPLSQVSIAAAIAARGTTADKNPALIRLRFFADDRELSQLGDVHGLSRSEAFGNYTYLGARGAVDAIEFRKIITIPPGVNRVGAAIIAWHAPLIGVSREVEIAPFTGEPEDILWEQTLPVPDLSDLCIEVTLDAAGSHPSRAPALLGFTFQDASGTPILQLPEGIGLSKKFGPYAYLGRPGDVGRLTHALVVPPSHGTERVSLRLLRFGAETLTATHTPKVSFRHLDQAGQTGNLLADIDLPVREGDTWDIGYRSAGNEPLANGFALLRHVFLDAQGWQVPLPDPEAITTGAGSYRYFEIADDVGSHGRVTLAVPPGAVRLQAEVLGWRLPDDHRSKAVIEPVCLGDGKAAALQGVFAGEGIDGPQAFSAKLAASASVGRSPGLIEWLFEDAQGAPLAARAEGLTHTSLYPNCTPLRRSGDDGVIFAAGRFEPPPGTRRILWRLRPLGGVTITPLAELTLQPVPHSLDEIVHGLPSSARMADHITPDRCTQLRHACLPDSFMEGVVGGSLRLLGEAILPCGPGEWLELHARIAAPASQLAPEVVVHCVFCNAEGKRIDSAGQPGCRVRKNIGTVRAAAVVPLGASGANLREAFLAPADAAIAIMHVALAEPRADVELGDIMVAAIARNAVLAGLDTTGMRHAELVDAAEVADAAGNRSARHALAIALAALAPKDPRLAQQARTLARDLEASDPEWLPWVPVPPPSSGDPASILHIGLGIDPADCALAAAQAARGLCPLVYLPLAAPCPPALHHAPDGMALITQHGVRIAYPRYPGLANARLPSSDRLSLDALLASRVIQEQRISLIHTAPGAANHEHALAAIALALAHRLPLVCEVRSFGALEIRLMLAADAVVAASETALQAAAERGVAVQRLFLVPDADDPHYDAVYAAARRGHADRMGRGS